METKYKVAIGLSLTVIAFFIYRKMQFSGYVKAIKTVSPTATNEGLSAMDRGYVASRAKAINANEETFTFQDKIYVTSSGRGYAAPVTDSNTGISGGEVEAPKVKEFSIFDYKTWY